MEEVGSRSTDVVSGAPTRLPERDTPRVLITTARGGAIYTIHVTGDVDSCVLSACLRLHLDSGFSLSTFGPYVLETLIQRQGTWKNIGEQKVEMPPVRSAGVGSYPPSLDPPPLLGEPSPFGR
jgi:hypothetical protein